MEDTIDLAGGQGAVEDLDLVEFTIEKVAGISQTGWISAIDVHADEPGAPLEVQAGELV